MKDLFNPAQEEKSIVNDNNGKMSIRRAAFTRKVTQSKRNLGFQEILNQNGGLPDHGECLLIKSNGTSDTGSLFQSISHTGTVEELYLSTWIISRLNIDFLCEQVDKGNIKSLTFIVSVRMTQMSGGSGKATYAHLVEEFQKRPQIKFRVCNSHAKTFSCKVANNYYTCTGSGNWTKNPRIENYILINDKEPFLHNKEWMSELIDG